MTRARIVSRQEKSGSIPSSCATSVSRDATLTPLVCGGRQTSRVTRTQPNTTRRRRPQKTIQNQETGQAVLVLLPQNREYYHCHHHQVSFSCSFLSPSSLFSRIAFPSSSFTRLRRHSRNYVSSERASHALVALFLHLFFSPKRFLQSNLLRERERW